MQRLSPLYLRVLVAASCFTLAVAQADGQTTSPLAPLDELNTFELADEALQVELVVAEPEVVSPVAIAWDGDGVLYVVEMAGYPLTPKSGRIKRLEDRDGDGRYESVEVFADRLDFPNGVMPYRDGLLVTAAPEILFLRYADDDGVADERRVMYTGFRPGNQQLRVNGLYWGLDNWIYGANGRSGGAVRPAAEADAAEISIEQRDFRIHPFDGRFEAIMGMSQFGLAHDDWGNRFTTFNHIFARHVALESRHVERNPQLVQDAVVDTAEPGDDRRVYYRAGEKPSFNRDPAGYFTSLSGMSIYRGDRLGEAYRGDAFAGESAQNVVIHRRIERDGPTFVARRVEQGRDFLASTDSWFHPVFFATGPDGALYIVDFYRQLVEHPQWAEEDKSRGVDWRIGAERGRIWRVVRRSEPAALAHRQPPRLRSATVQQLVATLESPVGWRRDMAQQLLVERRDQSAMPALTALMESESPRARLHALWTLQGLGGLKSELLLSAMRDADPHVRANATRLAEERLGEEPLHDALIAMVDDPDEAVRFQAALALGAAPGEESLAALARLARTNAGRPLTRTAILSSVGPTADVFVQRLLNDMSDDEERDPVRLQFLHDLGRLAARNSASGAAAARDWLIDQRLEPRRSLMEFTVFAGIAEGLAERQHPLRKLLRNSSSQFEQLLSEAFEEAARLAGSDRQRPRVFAQAAGLLAHAPSELGGDVLLSLFRESATPAAAAICVHALADLNDGPSYERLFTSIDNIESATRREIVIASLRSPAAASALIEAIDRGQVDASEIPEDVRISLLKVTNEDLRQRAASLLSETVSADRQKILDEYQQALKLAGHTRRGAQVFHKNCMTCHATAGIGGSTGPDLTRIGARSNQALLTSILDPSREVSYQLKTYLVLTDEGRIHAGVIVSDTPSVVTIRTADGQEATILRENIEQMEATGKSIMPDGFERTIDPQAMADLLHFLKHPDRETLEALGPQK